MSSHKFHNEARQIYFCTVTCYQWLPLFQVTGCYASVYRWFRMMRNDGCETTGYVIMPNHFHVLLYLSHGGTSLNKMVGEGKRFMAYDIVNALKRNANIELLNTLERGVPKKEKLKGKLHQVFRISFDARICYDEKMVEQKLEYIHQNPVKGKWSLVKDFTDFPHSSAAFYELGKPNDFVDIKHYKELGA